jgi:uncharacterized protein
LPQVGIAHSAYVHQFLRDYPNAVDFVEMPFELLHHDSSFARVGESKPLVLHCASLSIAGSVLPDNRTVSAVQRWIEETGTPWLGEHLAFVTAERGDTLSDEYAPGEPYNIGYTINPPGNTESLEFVLRSLDLCEKRFSVPVLLENSPVYFEPPGSTMTQIEFINEICAQSGAQLLVDLSHFYISARTLGFDPVAELRSLPLDRVVEVHVSGVEVHDGMHLDDHNQRAPDIVFEMLAALLRHAPVQAVTLEYNWSMRFPISVLLEEIVRTRQVIAAVAAEAV